MESRHSRSLIPASPDAAGCLRCPNESVIVAMQSKANFDFFKSLSLLDVCLVPEEVILWQCGAKFVVERSCS